MLKNFQLLLNSYDDHWCNHHDPKKVSKAIAFLVNSTEKLIR